MKKIIFFNHKGGVGKSTMTSVAANILSKQNKKVLIIDLDEQGCQSEIFKIQSLIKNGLSNKTKSPISIALMGWAKAQDVTFKVNNNLAIMVNDSNAIVNNIIKKDGLNINSFINTKDYDYIFFDLPPVLNETVLAVLKLIDEIYLVLDCEKASSSKAKALANYLIDQDINTNKIKATIPNKYLYIHKSEHDKVIDNYTLDLDKTVETLSPIKNKIAVKDKDRLDEYIDDFDEIIQLIKKGEK